MEIMLQQGIIKDSQFLPFSELDFSFIVSQKIYKVINNNENTVILIYNKNKEEVVIFDGLDKCSLVCHLWSLAESIYYLRSDINRYKEIDNRC